MLEEISMVKEIFHLKYKNCFIIFLGRKMVYVHCKNTNDFFGKYKERILYTL